MIGQNGKWAQAKTKTLAWLRYLDIPGPEHALKDARVADAVPKDRSALFLAHGLAVFLFAMPILRYFALRTSFYDLGQYTNNYSNIAIDGLWDTAAQTHLHLPMILFAPVFKVFPSPVTLLVMQSSILIAGMAVFARLCSVMGASSPLAAVAMYGVTLAVWSSALSDYHFEHLLFPLYGAFVLTLHTRPQASPWLLITLALAICGVKEVYALSAAMLGLVVMTYPGRRACGAAICILSFAYFFAATHYVIPAFSNGRGSGELWGEAFGHLGASPGEMVTKLLTSPWLAIESGFFERKFYFVAALLVPALHAFRWAPLWLLPALPHLAISCLSKKPTLFYLGHQYTVPVTVAVIGAIVISLGRSPLPARRYLILFTIGTSLAVLAASGVSPVSRLFWSPFAWTYQLQAYIPTGRDNQIRGMIEAHIPSNRAVVVSMQSSLHTGRLSNRTHAIAFPQGVIAPALVPVRAALLTHGTDKRMAQSGRSYASLAHEGYVEADFVVLDPKRPWTVNDRFCSWDAAAPCSDPAIRTPFLEARDKLPAHFELIAHSDGFEIWRRKPLT